MSLDSGRHRILRRRQLPILSLFELLKKTLLTYLSKADGKIDLSGNVIIFSMIYEDYFNNQQQVTVAMKPNATG